MAHFELDARRMFCPMPVIRTQDKINKLNNGDTLEVVSTDPGALSDIPAWCRINGHRVIETRNDEASGEVFVLIEACNTD
ncbi:tRNA 5-methylaminomethyl-2-thiouridine synthesis sulfur carrier protein TusA [hydrothermal vent metagenome]|uniref:tRNA 5-methylaminomethyl-2-thiouridine synthesis sulfur carrier protein TusA n=1 Tax=hydrothermal vent metagenome TaxID=652676 RepID=A0A3B0X4P7_9ZZZZ